MEQNNPPVLEEKPAKSHKAVVVSAIAVVSILVLAGIFLIVWNYQKKAQKIAVQPSGELNAQQQNAPAVTQNIASTAKSNKDDFVEWYPAPKEIPAPKLFINENEPNIYNNETRKYKAWEVGKFIGEVFKNQAIVLVMGESVDPGGPDIWRFLKDSQTDNKETFNLLSFYSKNDFTNIETNPDVVSGSDHWAHINSLDFPGVLYTPKGEKMLKKEDFPYEAIYDEKANISDENILFRTDLLKKAFTDPVYGDFYTTDPLKGKDFSKDSNVFTKYGFYARVPDGTFKVYAMSVEFLDKDSVANVIWNDGANNTSHFTYQGASGCGANKYSDVVDNELTMDDLSPAGKTITGDTIYEYKDKVTKYLKDFYQEDVSYAKDNSDLITADGKKFTQGMTYDQFVSSHVVFFWKDPFGRIVRFINNDYKADPGGCGKPVIYLYPEKTQNVFVKVMPSGGLTVSEPDYGNGWNVIADPMSRIKNLADGKTYPYLFWEGSSKEIYQMSKYGFVAGRDGLENLLDDKLSKLGLIQKEISDFKEFWLPKMLAENKPYYFVTFVSRNMIDKIAPLDISPKPDTIIRVLMDYKGLDEKIDAPGYNIKTPERKGFTAVEWGGMLK